MKIKSLALITFLLIGSLAKAQDGAIGAGGVSLGGGGGSSSGGTMPITGSGNTVTTDIPLIDGTETWNNGALAFSAIRINITNTASAATSSLLKLQIASANLFNVDRAGVVELAAQTKLSSDGDGILKFTKNAGTDPVQLEFGGAAYLRVEGNGLAIYNPSLASYYDLTARNITASSGILDVSGITKARAGITLGNSATPSISSSVPSVASGFGTSPSLSTSSSGGALSFRLTVGSGGIATTGALNFATAATAWNCMVSDLTGGIATRQTAGTTSQATITSASAWAAASVLLFICASY